LQAPGVNKARVGFERNELMTKSLGCAGLCLLFLTGDCVADDLPKPAPNPIKKVEAKFEPATAKPGQTVTLKIELKLEDGWLTYPTHQPDSNAKAFVNKVVLPKAEMLRFAGMIKEPADPKVREYPELGIK